MGADEGARRGVVLGVSSDNSIGAACARRLGELGASVAVTCRPERRRQLDALAERRGWIVVSADADDDASLDAAFAELGRRWGRLDFLVHTWMRVPGALLSRPLVELGREDFRQVVEVGAYSLVAACRRALPLLSASASPRVVTMTSASSHRMTPSYHVAGIAKAALEAALLYLAAELSPRGILCNAVSFSLVATDGATALLGEKTIGATRAFVDKRAPTRHGASAEDVAAAAAWLCSAQARNLTGEILTVDGGYARTYF